MDFQSGSAFLPANNELGSVAETTVLKLRSVQIGTVLDISGSASRISLDPIALQSMADSQDPSLSLAGQVGSQIKVRVGSTWLVANVRTLSKASDGSGQVSAMIDFLGEGDEERLTGKIYNFRRGVTRYPFPDAPVFPASSDDMRQLYAADDRANIEIGTVYPTNDVRGALYVDAMLGKHFALLGSTGTGKSTSAALILHKICELAPQGHIVMIDPHGEYSAAFKTNGALFDVSNLAMPYWLMNFEEHCEVFLTTHGNERQADADVLSKCLLAARSKSRVAEGISKLTVDSPIPYLLSDLTSLIQAEMGKLEKAGDNAPYMRVKTKIEEIKSDPRYTFMFSGMSRIRWRASCRAFSACLAMAAQFQSLMCLACLRILLRSLLRCWRGWFLIMPSGHAMNRSARSCSSVKRPTAMCRPNAMPLAILWVRFWAGSPRKVVNMASRLA